MANSPEQMRDKMIANMPAKTGKSLEEWLKIVAASGLEKHGEIIKLLKGEHGMTHGFANLVAHYARNNTNFETPENPVADQYAGPKAGLKPIYDKLIGIVEGLGKDVEVSPKKTYVSLRRSKQFALIQPSTKTRVDLGLNLKGVEPEGRIEASGSFNSMVTHRVRLSSPADVDKDVAKWLKQAYQGA